jgi:hypothetical protein
MQVRVLLLDPTKHVAVTGKATAAPAKRGHAGSSPARNFIPAISDRGSDIGKSMHRILLNADV